MLTYTPPMIEDIVVEVAQPSVPTRRSLPRALSVSRADFSLTTLAKIIIVFIPLGPILVPLMWLSGVPVLQSIAAFGYEFGRGICSYTVKSLQIGGLDMMVCTRCFGVAMGLLTTGMLYFYSPLVKAHLPRRKLYLASFIAVLFIPWLIDSGLQRLDLWVTDHWLMFPTGFLGGVAVTLAPLLFFPPEEDAAELA